MPIWSLRRDYGSKLRELNAELQERLNLLPGFVYELQPILDLWHSGRGMPVNRDSDSGEDDDDDSDDQPPPLALPPSLMNEWVRIGPSRITGAVAGQNDGLIAVRDIPRNTTITNYKTGATKLNEQEFRARYPTGKEPTHTWSGSKGVYYDASNPTTLWRAPRCVGTRNQTTRALRAQARW